MHGPQSTLVLSVLGGLPSSVSTYLQVPDLVLTLHKRRALTGINSIGSALEGLFLVEYIMSTGNTIWALGTVVARLLCTLVVTCMRSRVQTPQRPYVLRSSWILFLGQSESGEGLMWQQGPGLMIQIQRHCTRGSPHSSPKYSSTSAFFLSSNRYASISSLVGSFGGMRISGERTGINAAVRFACTSIASSVDAPGG